MKKKKTGMGSYLNSTKERMDAIIGIVEDFFAGKDIEYLKVRFNDELGGKISAGEFALSEQKIDEKNISNEQLEDQIDDLLIIFKSALEEESISGLPAGHPLDTFVKENIAIKGLLSELREAQKSVDPQNIDADFWKEAYERIGQINTHYVRKENQLFPYLEKKKFFKPSKVMWMIHDRIRKVIKKNTELLNKGDFKKLFAKQEKMFKLIEGMIFKEEKILWPTSLELLFDEEWLEIRNGEEEVGYCLIEKPEKWEG